MRQTNFSSGEEPPLSDSQLSPADRENIQKLIDAVCPETGEKLVRQIDGNSFALLHPLDLVFFDPIPHTLEEADGSTWPSGLTVPSLETSGKCFAAEGGQLIIKDKKSGSA